MPRYGLIDPQLKMWVEIIREPPQSAVEEGFGGDCVVTDADLNGTTSVAIVVVVAATTEIVMMLILLTLLGKEERIYLY